jgi:FemAB-related protein (PEP-CTERM system-associated)
MPYSIDTVDFTSPCPEWNHYLTHHSASTLFHRLEWLQLISKVYSYDVYAFVVRNSGRITGLCPIVHLKTPLFGNALISTAFGTAGGILADTPENYICLQKHLETLAKELNVDYVECRGTDYYETEQNWHFKSSTYAGYRMALASSDEDRLQQMRKKKRNEIRKALSHDLEVQYDVPVETFYKVYSQSLRDHGTPTHPLGWYETLLQIFGTDAQTMVILDKNAPACACLALYHKNYVTPHYSGGLPEARPIKAFDVMYWHLMKKAQERGCEIFDFGRSKIGSGAASYKIYWGFEEKPLHYQYYLQRGTKMPDVNPNNPKYAMFVKLWQKLPVSVTNQLGPLLAKQLG